MLKFKLVTPPNTEPVTLDQIKDQSRIDRDDDSFDNEINGLIPAARQWCEDHQKRAYITQTWEIALDHWPRHIPGDIWQSRTFIKLPRPPLQEVVSFQFTKADGTTETWDQQEYLVDNYSEPCRIVPKNNWPHNSLIKTNGIIIRYKTGYGGNPDDVPEKIRQAIILLVSYWLENGQCNPPQAVYSLLNQERVISI